MYKVAIIDDEPIIAEGLSRIMAWEKWNCRVAGSAYNGKEGLALIHREQPDIIISDINMPELNGLEMVAAFKSEYPDMQLIILTGYREFEYARQAIELGVARFLLKPSKMNELEEAMEVVTERLKRLEGDVSPVIAEEETGISSFADKEPEKDGACQNEANSFVVKNALEYIWENSEDKLRLADVADQVYVSQWHLSKLLNKQTGKNFSELLNSARIEKSEELLKDPSLRICDVAERVGFQDLAHFSRVFKKMKGMSANEYRNMQG